MSNKLIYISVFLLIGIMLYTHRNFKPSITVLQYNSIKDTLSTPIPDTLNSIQNIYQSIKHNDINYDVFVQAMKGFEQIKNNKRVLTIIDFSKPSTQERFYVVDLDRKEILFRSHVAHGKNSGGNMATEFSNKNGSNKSSLGFYLTAETYTGKNGYSLKLDGLEKGINDQARTRAIVIHGAAYANASSTTSLGRLGRSLGCPALPKSLNKPIIDTIKEGTVLFIYAPDKTYLQQSALLAG